MENPCVIESIGNILCSILLTRTGSRRTTHWQEVRGML